MNSTQQPSPCCTSKLIPRMAEYQRGNTHPIYDVNPDGQRFVMLRMGNEGAASAEAYIVTNWFEELRQRMAN